MSREQDAGVIVPLLLLLAFTAQPTEETGNKPIRTEDFTFLLAAGLFPVFQFALVLTDQDRFGDVAITPGALDGWFSNLNLTLGTNLFFLDRYGPFEQITYFTGCDPLGVIFADFCVECDFTCAHFF